MARYRQQTRTGIIRLSPSARKSRAPSHDQKLAFISKYERVPDPYNTRAVNRRYSTLRKFPLYLQRPANKSTREHLKERGFFVTQKGVIIDSPRDSKRKQIKGAVLDIQSDATIKWTVTRETKKQRTIRSDYIIGFTKKEKREFAANPNAFIEKKKAELKKTKAGLRGKRDSQIQVRLQWGAYQATKDFHQGYFTKRYSHLPERDLKRVHDRLTGLHIVVHSTKHLTGLHLTTKTTRRKHGKK